MGREQQDYSEKRDFIRMFIDAPVDFCLSGTEDWQKGIGRDLSAKGMAFSSNTNLPEGTLIEIKLKPATNVTPPLEATAKVIRCVANETGGFEVSAILEKIHR